MKSTVKQAATPDQWDAKALYNKSVRYIQHLPDLNNDAWEYALWSSLALELLGRAALSNVNPSLLADTDGKQWSSLYHSLGFSPTEKGFSPKSITVSEVFKRLQAIFNEFTKEDEAFCLQHTAKRNAELHSGELAFDGVKASIWQPNFFKACQVLLETMGESLENFIGIDEAKAARQMIVAAADKSAEAVKGDVDAHMKVWLAKNETERKTLADQAIIWATRHYGHRVSCPACSSQALLFGSPISAPTIKLVDGNIIEMQDRLPTNFECIACGLKVSGLSRLTAISLGDRYKNTLTYDAADYYAPQDEFDGYEEDNNER